MAQLSECSTAKMMWFFVFLAALPDVFSSAIPEVQLWAVSASPHHPVLRYLSDNGLVDVWSHNGNQTHIVTEKEAEKRIREVLLGNELQHFVAVDDILHLVAKEEKFMKEKKWRRKREADQMDWASYHDLEDIEGYLGWLNASTGSLVTVLQAAVTEEGRPVYVVRVSDPNTFGPKKKIWIEGGIHAREWISPAATTYLLHEVATSPYWRPMLERTEWYFVPVANPDGYVYTFLGGRARFWRKNRRSSHLNISARCKGTDLNRNWDLKWGVGASGNPCSETFKGTAPFSEPETYGLQNLMRNVSPIDLLITFHSFGQTVLYPWGWTNDPPPNTKQLHRLGRRFVDAVKYVSQGSTNYDIGGSGPLYGFASGATDDWAYGALRTPYSYTIELRDQGSHGFLLPESKISETVRETAVGVYCMVGLLADVGPCSKQKNWPPRGV